jgi:hypothetical protein
MTPFLGVKRKFAHKPLNLQMPAIFTGVNFGIFYTPYHPAEHAETSGSSPGETMVYSALREGQPWSVP